MRVLDVGANCGYFTLLMARCVGPNGEVFSFEPHPRTFRLLVRNIELNGYGARVRPFPMALGARSGKVKLVMPAAADGIWTGDATIEAAATWEWGQDARAESREEHVVDLACLDALSVGRIDVAKIDAEGSEPDIWRGGRQTLSAARALIIEYAPRRLNDGLAFLHDIASAGFRLHILDEDGRRLRVSPMAAHHVAQERAFISLLCRK
jgi:FkbM family methyltransferase